MSLTKREIQVLELAQLGYSIKMIAEKLGIAYETVKSNRRNIYNKLRCNSITGAVDAYQKQKTPVHA